MNNKLLIALLCLVGTCAVTACKKVENGKFVEPITLYEKIKGSWQLTDLVQIDETAKISGIKPDEISLLGQFEAASLQLTLDVDADNQPTAYRVDGSAPELFPNGGFWDLDTAFPYADGSAPTIRLYSDAAKTALIGQLTIVSMPGAAPEMGLKLTRSTAGVPFVSYQYKLSNTNQ
ncbi:DUF5004 domain-containing protein [Parapedobacter sp. 2B3]|uniref:DUF5004 domain-containing protein n=1 Tax=Parapedobacter sp. 2B3 TaxID=3342381 RepID=UPI0035B62A65